MSEKTLIIIPTYNERDNITPLINELSKVRKLVVFDVLFIDDNSPDGTGDLIKEHVKHDKWIKLIVRTRERGLGSALYKGYQYAYENNYDYVLQMDADLQHPPSVIPDLISKLKLGCDVVVASRYIEKGGSEGWPFYRRLISKVANKYATTLLNIKIKDVTSGYRGFNIKAIRDLLNYRLSSKGYVFQVETLALLSKLGYKICETPFIFKKRIKGSSKLGFKEVIKYFISVLKIRGRIARL